MTQYSENVDKQRQLLDKESLDKKIKAIEIRPGRIQTWYYSGRVVTEFPRDKRKNTITDYRGLDNYSHLIK